MSGRKQHFIPQSLLSGFGVDRRKKSYVVAYTYERGIFASPTDGIGAERHFYSELDVEGLTDTLDDKITDYEQQIPSILKKFRNEAHAIDPKAAAELVAHLTVRNDHLRNAASIGGTGLFISMFEALRNEGIARQLFSIDDAQPNERQVKWLGGLWDEHATQLQALGMNQDQFQQVAFQEMKGRFSKFHAEMVGPLREIFTNILDQLPDIAARAQKRALTKSLAPPLRVEGLTGFYWKTVETLDSLVLPDCVAIALDSKDGLVPLMLADLKKTSAIFMPLASQRLLVGSLQKAAKIPQGINEVFARCSWDFFVARDRLPQLEGYRHLLRSTTERFMTNTIAGVLHDVLTTGISFGELE